MDLNIEQINKDQITRFKRVISYIEKNPFPSVPRIDKTNPNDKSPYKKDDILPCNSLYFGGKDWKFLNSDLAVAIIGTTSPTSDGAKLSISLAHSFIEYGRKKSQEPLIIAGGVYGIDQHAHLGALDMKGRTIAVVANPVQYGLHPYVPKRIFLEEGILQYGGIVSEQTEYAEERLPRCLQRNRLISALSDLVIVVESGQNSGTNDNALKAILQGVPLVVIDWSKINNTWKWSKPKSEGNEQLLSMQIEHRPAPYRFPEKPVKSVDDLGDLFKDFLAQKIKL